MARDTGYQQREGNPRQGAGQSFGESTKTTDQAKSSADANARAKTTGEQTDRQRSIQTGRERGMPTGLSRDTNPMVYGSPYGPMASPFSMMRRMADDMDRLLENFGFGRAGMGLSPFLGKELDRDPWRQTSALRQSAWAPQVETFRKGDQLIVRADLPGLKKDDVKVEVDDGILTISGERTDEREENRDDCYRTERSYGQFYRAIPLPDGVDAKECDASFKDGVLEVKLRAPREQERKARQIPIR